MNYKTLLLLATFFLTLSFTSEAATFYSQGTGNFSTLSNWNTDPGGAGSNPIASDLTDGTNDFIIQDGHTITVDQDIDVSGITVGGGASGILTIGNDATARNLVVQGPFIVSSGAALNVGAFNATHSIDFQGAITNNGSFDLFNSSTQVANSSFNGTFSIGGANTPQFSNVGFNSGTVTAGIALDIEGSVTIETATTFADGGFTHTVGQNWTENGSGQLSGSGTIEMDASVVQSINTAATFNNLSFIGGGIVVISGNVTVNGNFLVSNNTSLNTSTNNAIRGNFTIDPGSSFSATAGTMDFDGSTTQAITVNSSTSFDNVDFDNGGAGNPKNITGNFVANDRTRIFDDAVVNDAAGGQSHTLQELRLDGVANFSGTLTFIGGNIYDNTDNTLVLGTANVIIQGGTSVFSGDDAVTINGDLTVQTGTLTISENATVAGAGGTLFVSTGTTLRMQGTNNFPTGFGTVTFESRTARSLYDLNGAQTIRGGVNYGELEIGGGGTKTADGNIDIQGDLDLNAGITLLLLAFDLDAGEDIQNGTNSSITAIGGTITMDAVSSNQSIAGNGTGFYIFNNFVIDNTSATSTVTKQLFEDIVFTGNFTVLNGAQICNVDINDHTMLNDGGDVFTLGANVRLFTNGANSFNISATSYASLALDVDSEVLFDGTAQNLPGGFTYGRITLLGSGNKTAQANMDVDGYFLTAGSAVFVDNGFSHTVAGDWLVSQASTSMTGSMTFDGLNQTIRASNFNNVTFANSGNKTFTGDMIVAGNLAIDDGVSVIATTRDISIAGDWSNPGTGSFSQTTGFVEFNGTADQNITSNANGAFGDLDIDKSSGTVIAQSDFIVNRDLELVQNNAALDLNGQTAFIGRDWINRTGTTFTANGGTLHFDGDIQQDLLNYNASTVYGNLEFSGAGEKNLSQNGMDIDGSVTISGGIFNAGGLALSVAGDWNNAGSFQHTNTVTLDGGNQSVSASTFHDLVSAGTGTKTLGGNITLDGRFEIQDGVTFDVSASNFNITVEETWTNSGTGVFNEQNGTVTFTGGSSTITTGATGPTVGKRFYNVIINSSGNETLAGDMDVENDFTVTSGTFTTSTFDIFVGGSFTNNSTFNHNNNASVLTFDGTSGSHTFEPGGTFYRDITVDGAGATYTLQSDIIFNTTTGRTFTINAGTFSTGANDISHTARDATIQVNTNGTFNIEAGAVVTLGREAIVNTSGTFNIIGNSGSPATLTSNQLISSRFITFTMTGGSIGALFAIFEKTMGNGVDIQGGTIDAVNNFSNSRFSNGSGTSYLTLTGLNLGAGITVTDAVFNTGPTFNVSRTSGTGTITFQDATGTLAGESFDNDDGDPGTLINWTFPGGFFFDNDAADNDWHNPLNWSGNTVPDGSSNVILEHTQGGITAAYTVNIVNNNGLSGNLTIDTEGGNPITLVINGRELSVQGNFQNGSGGTVTQTTATDFVSISGSWTNEGTFNEGTSSVRFVGTSGVNPIITGGASDPFYNLEIDGAGAVYTLQSTVDIDNNFTLDDGEIQFVNQSVTVGGDWTINGGTFDAGSSLVTFDKGGTSTQSISGGTFFDFEVSNSSGSGTATKQLTGGLTVEDDLRIRANSVLDGGTNIMFVRDNWRNDVGNAGFTQSGIGAVIFDGDGQTIGDNGLETTFNNVFLQGTGNKTFNQSATMNGDFSIASGLGTVVLTDGITITGSGGANTLSMSGSTLSVRGDTPTNFPTGFETINLTGGVVEYRSDMAQDVFETTYFDLRVRNNTNGNAQTKTLTGDIEITDDLIINDVDTELDVAGFTITLNDNISFPTGGTPIAWNGGTLLHTGAGWNIDVDITEFNNMILSGSGTKTMLAPLSITGDITVQSGVTLNIGLFPMTSTGAGNFTLSSGAILTSNIPSSTGPSFPTAFASYVLDIASRVRLRVDNDKTIYTNGGTITYGILDMNYQGTATPDGNLDVDGDFLASNNDLFLQDGGFNINLSGENVDMRNYTATSNTFSFDGADQTIQFLNGDTNPDVITFDNVLFTGSGSKPFTSGDDLMIINGDFTIDVGISMTSNIDFQSRGNWTNNGSFSQTGGILTFDGTGTQTIDPGAVNTIDDVVFSNGGANAKTIVNNGMDINGELAINAGATADFGSLTHTIASGTITNNGTWNTSAANLTFDRAGAQQIPAITALDVICATGGTKTLQGDWSVDDLSINPSVTLDANTSGNHNITLTGNWSNIGGTFTRRLGTVAFESNDGTAKTIQTNGSDFYNVTFNQAQTNSRTYTLLEDTEIDEDLTIGSGATLDVSGFDLTLGDNDSGNPGGENHLIEAGAELIIDDNATLFFDTNDGDADLTVEGTFTVVGSSGNIANVTRSAGGNRINIDITTGTIAARFYHFRFMVNDGMDIQSTATIDATNNLSDGSWSDITTGGGVTKRYLIIEIDATGFPDINNVSFNHGTSPQIGVHFNVQRSAGATGGAITFGGTISGLMGSELYEDDPAGTQINWPPSSIVTWVGTINSDWHTAGNWSPATVPTNLVEAVIPSASNNPLVSLADASAQKITLTDGILTIDAGFDLTVTTDVVIGNGGSPAVLAVANTTSEITVGGGWTLGTNAIFSNGGSSVTFNAATGTPVILPRSSAFNNLNFNGSATFGISGDMDVDGNIVISNGVVQPTTNNYTITLEGDLNNVGGTFENTTTGVLELDGADQDVTNVTVNGMDVSGTGTKTMNGTVTIAGILNVNSTIAGAAGSLIEMDADVFVNPGGTFDDGGETHTFSGDDWTGNGSYTGTGTINFDRTGAQDINGGQFNTLDFTGTGQINILGNVDVTGDVTARNTIGTMRCNTFLIDNTSGTGTFTLESLESIYLLGANNFPSNFATYNLDPTSTTRYEGTIDQTIAGVNYGRLILLNANTKTLGGSIDVDGDLLDVNTATLDVSASNHTISLEGTLDLNDGGSFVARNGEVILDGSTGNQTLSLGLPGTSDFYRVTVNNSALGTITVGSNDIVIAENLRVFNGTFNLNGLNGTISGDMTASGGGQFSTSGTYILNQSGGSANIQSNGSILNNLTINGSGTTFTSIDAMTLNGNFTLTAGTFDGNGQTIGLGNGADVATISGTYIVGAGGRIEMGNGASLLVNTGGSIEIVGSGAQVATVTRRVDGRYNFTVNGTISASNYLFEWMDDDGIFITSSGTIDGINNFSDGTFTNGDAGRTMLKIENTQDFTGGSAINNVSFPTNPGGGAFNVSKTTAVSGTLEFFNSTGTFSGESFDNDPNNLINWTGPVTLVWDGSVSSDWYNANNWTPAQVPTSADNAQIVAAGSAPVITSNGAQVNNLEIASGALTINTADAGIDLEVFGDFTINSVFSMVSGNDRIEVDGNWTRGGGGTFSAGTGIVAMSNPSGLTTLNNGTSSFYDLEINGAGTVQIASNTDVNNDFTVTSGIFDVTSSDFDLNIGGDFSNSGTFLPNSGQVIMDASGAVTRTINLGSSSLFDLDINGGASTVIQVTTNDLTVNNDIELLGGTMDLNARTLNLGGQLSVSGTFEADANSVLDMGAGSSVTVNSGGVFSAVGSNASNLATVTGTVAGRYSFIVSSGGEIEAQFYLMEFMNTTGIQIAAGGLIDATNNFSNGIFSNGASGGRYLLLQNNFTDFTASNVAFNNGPSVNVRRVSGTGIITFEDATGILAGQNFEDDSPNGSATTGFIRWSFTNPVLTWDNGGGDNDWHNPNNWDDGFGGTGVPTNITNTFIPNTGFDPIISSADADAGELTINAGATLTINSNRNLTIAGDLSNAGTVTVAGGGTTTIEAGGSWTNTGTFNSGGSSTVRLTAATGTNTITTNGSSFCSLEINSAAPGTSIFQSQDAIDIDCNFTIVDGTLDITNAAHAITLGGNWDVNAAGTYTNGGSTVTFDGAAQNITMSSGDSFGDVIVDGTSTKTLLSSISMDDLTINSTLAPGANGVTLTGNWTNNGTFTFATSTVSFTGSAQQLINNASGEDFFSLTLNNTSGIFPQIVITGPITVNDGGTLTLTDGIIESSTANMFTVDDNTTLVGGTSGDSYISGPMTKIGQQNFDFPIGKGSIFARLGVSGLLASGTFVAEYFDASFGDITREPALQSVSAIEYWDLDRTGGTGDPFVTLYWEDGTRSGVNSLPNLRVAHFTGGLWNDQGNGATGGTAAAGSVTSSVRISSFSPFTLGSDDPVNPLPVDLVEFTGRMVEGKVRLNWSTASEEDNDFFEVQTSLDGEQFNIIGIVDGAGNSNELLNYRFIHETPAMGINYYRLRQVDFDGEFEYSEVIRVDNNIDQVNIEFELSPNPTTFNNIRMRINPMDVDDDVRITIIDAFGRFVREDVVGENFNFNEVITLRSSVMSSGMYFVIVEQGSYISKKKLIIR